jgi:hypothetical protein
MLISFISSYFKVPLSVPSLFNLLVLISVYLYKNFKIVQISHSILFCLLLVVVRLFFLYSSIAVLFDSFSSDELSSSQHSFSARLKYSTDLNVPYWRTTKFW